MALRIFNQYIRMPFLVLAAVEACAFVAAVYLGMMTRFPGLSLANIELESGPMLQRALVFTVIMMLALMAMGLYQARLRTQTMGTLLRILVGMGMGIIAASIFYYFVPGMLIGRGALALATLYALVLVSLIRYLFSEVVDENILKRRILVLGTGQKADFLAQLRRRSDRRGFRIVGFARVSDTEAHVDPEKILTLDKPLLGFARERDVDEIVVAIDDRRMRLPVQELLDCKLAGIPVVDLMTLFERETGRVRLDLLYPSWIIFSDGFSRNWLKFALERSFDVVVSSLLLILLWPLILLTALAVWISGRFREPVLYKQTRVGLEGRPFNVLKFRSMHTDAEQDGAQWATKDDSRVTRVGSIIRKLRLDELPQVFNVLRGDMSFVGPRPERPEFVDKLEKEIPYYRERHCVKPGITGWAQLNYPYGSSEQDAMRKLEYDLYYLKNHSLLFDIQILIRTVEIILFGVGAR